MLAAPVTQETRLSSLLDDQKPDRIDYREAAGIVLDLAFVGV